MAPSLFERVAAGRRRLIEAGFAAGDAALDAEVLARHVLGWDLAQLLARHREAAPPQFAERFDELIARRARREPVALIIGRREFWGLDFLVTPATLVPRPETEFIIEEALRRVPPHGACTVLDIGTGTGCLAVAITYERPAARAVATDISHEALLVARQNATAHGVAARVGFVRTDLAAGVAVHADLIVSNPPYVPDAAALAPDVGRYEPPSALFGGPDGLHIMRRLLTEVPAQLAPGGVLIVEFGYGQEDGVRGLALATGWHVERVLHDFQGIARTIVLRR
jgi:release factor glutamine methyltransferase